jgi:hypothetical protein
VPTIFAVYIGGSSRANLDYGLTNGRWAFTREQPDLDQARPGDLVLFGLGVERGPQQPAADWQQRTVPESHIARIDRSAYTATQPFWPDESPNEPPYYNPSIDITYLGSLASLSLTPGVDLSAALTEALRVSGVLRQAVRSATSGSPALAPGAPVLTRAPRPPRQTTQPGGGGPAAQAKFATLPRKAVAITLAQPTPPVNRLIIRREQELVDSYRKHMEAKGHSIVRLQIPNGSGGFLWNDIYDKNLDALIEAKGSNDRESIRMALGQVLDYQRWAKPRLRGVLLPDKPQDDLTDLLAANGIITIWQTSTGFADSQGGSLI